jgi:hypothetical protein
MNETEYERIPGSDRLPLYDDRTRCEQNGWLSSPTYDTILKASDLNNALRDADDTYFVYRRGTRTFAVSN